MAQLRLVGHHHENEHVYHSDNYIHYHDDIPQASHVHINDIYIHYQFMITSHWLCTFMARIIILMYMCHFKCSIVLKITNGMKYMITH